MTRVGVVGAGPMGRLHARTVRRLADRGHPCQLVRVFDRHVGRAEVLAAETGAAASNHLDAFAEQVDVVIIAVPAAAHLDLSKALLDRGLDLLVEKPLAGSVAEAESLIEAARRADRILQVGHIEWYNPSWRQAVSQVGTLSRIEVDRLQPSSTRGRDIDVVQDLMLHDLDWTLRLLGGAVSSLEAWGRCVEADQLDEAEARIRFESGCVVCLRASRVHRLRRREARIQGSAGFRTADLESGGVESTDRATLCAGKGEGRDSLESQWLDFLEAIRSRKAPVNDGRVGVDALRWVDRVRDAISTGTGSSSLDDHTHLRG
ncbi:MAG: Gfo/Idh/MocA family oxidoreductase [Deltaproteobacteria bacterium]|nr:Gfo/Idh/MocA family oxidoreductase [Deltaproteobacteria bacterium]